MRGKSKGNNTPKKSEAGFYGVVIGKQIETEFDVSIGTGLFQDEKGNDTDQVLVGVQFGEKGEPFFVRLRYKEGEELLNTLTKTLEAAREIRNSNK